MRPVELNFAMLIVNPWLRVKVPRLRLIASRTTA